MLDDAATHQIDLYSVEELKRDGIFLISALQARSRESLMGIRLLYSGIKSNAEPDVEPSGSVEDRLLPLI